MNQPLPWLATALLTMIAASAAPAQTPVPAPPVLVELFTSEGCSSCPPAEVVLDELASRPDVLALAYHVDYWDGIGWRDRFEIPDAVQRQDRYVRTLSLPSAFTPQIIVNGASSWVGSDRRRVLAAIERASANVAVKLKITAGEVWVELSDTAPADCDVNIVAYQSHAVTAVGRGENAGRTLDEFNIVRSFRHLGTSDGRARTFALARSSLPADADHVAVFLQQRNQGPITGATAVTLTP